MKVCVKCGKSDHTSVWYFCKKCQVFICGVCIDRSISSATLLLTQVSCIWHNIANERRNAVDSWVFDFGSSQTSRQCRCRRWPDCHRGRPSLWYGSVDHSSLVGAVS